MYMCTAISEVPSNINTKILPHDSDINVEFFTIYAQKKNFPARNSILGGNKREEKVNLGEFSLALLSPGDRGVFRK